VKFPISSYEKLLNNFLPKEFSEIESIEVKKPSIFEWIMDVVVIVHLKDSKSGGNIDSCHSFGKKVTPRIVDLIKYFGEGYYPDILVYRGGRNVCKYSDFYIGKK
jgi:hypothetical protein